jgi:hypothetical protein
LPNVGPYIYDVKISSFFKELHIYMYNISRIRVKMCPINPNTIVTTADLGVAKVF